MKLLALDTGTHKCGYALFEDDGLICSGVWRLYGDLDRRLGLLLENLSEMCQPVLPDLIAAEVPFVHPRTRKDTAIKLGQAVGMVKGWAWIHQVRVIEINPSSAKKALTGSGRATKFGVQGAVMAQFGIEAKEDEADAIAVGIAALAAIRLQDMLRQAESQQ